MSFAEVHGNGEANALGLDAWLGLAGHQGIDPNDFGLQVDQRAARIAGVDRSIGLDEAHEHQARLIGPPPAPAPRGSGRSPHPA